MGMLQAVEKVRAYAMLTKNLDNSSSDQQAQIHENNMDLDKKLEQRDTDAQAVNSILPRLEIKAVQLLKYLTEFPVTTVEDLKAFMEWPKMVKTIDSFLTF